MRRIDHIREIASEYVRHSTDNYELCTKLGRDIMKAFDEYLAPGGGLVIGVPPSGDWSSDQGDYRGASFSYCHQRLFELDDIQFGMAVRVDHIRDSGHFWMRIVVDLRKKGDRIGVSVGEGKTVWLPIEYHTGDLEPVCERIFAELQGAFQNQVTAFREGSDRATIGFTLGQERARG